MLAKINILYFLYIVNADISGFQKQIIDELNLEYTNLGNPNLTIQEILTHMNENLLIFIYPPSITPKLNYNNYVNDIISCNTNPDIITQINYKINNLKIETNNLTNIIYSGYINHYENNVFSYSTNYKLIRYTNLKKYMLKIINFNIYKNMLILNPWITNSINYLDFNICYPSNGLANFISQLNFNIYKYVIFNVNNEINNINNYDIDVNKNLLTESLEWKNKRKDIIKQLNKYT